MDDEDFEDLLDGVDVLPDSSQESLTFAAANLDFRDDSDDGGIRDGVVSPPSSVCDVTMDGACSSVQNVQMHKPSLSDEATTDNNKLYPLVPEANKKVIEKIEKVFEGVMDALYGDDDDLSITLKLRTSRAKSESNLAKTGAPKAQTARSKRLCFPGKTEEDAWRFTVVIRILELIHEALRKDIVLSQRDIYYRDPALFGRQAVVNRYIDDIAFTFDVTRSKLNITAVAKGLVVGKAKLCRRDGSSVDATGDREGMLIPSLTEILSVDLRSVKWILVVEKEASFRSIAASEFWNTISTEGVMVTGKGYPDIATRALVRFLSTPSPRNAFFSIPVFGLVDFDPDGLAILSIYKHGSAALAHENENLCVPQMRWLGLTPEDIKSCGDDVHASQGLLALTERDRKKANKMLEKCDSDSEGSTDGTELRKALQTMLMLNMKAELQLLEARCGGMADLLQSKLASF